MSRHFTPARIKLHEKLDDHEILLQGPFLLNDVGVKMVVPSFTTLLANSARQYLSNLCPVFGAVVCHNFCQELIFFFGPGCTDHVITICEFQVALVAFDLGFAEQLAQTIP